MLHTSICSAGPRARAPIPQARSRLADQPEPPANYCNNLQQRGSARRGSRCALRTGSTRTATKSGSTRDRRSPPRQSPGRLSQ